MPTLAREWYNEGIEKGMQQGMSKGRNEGRNEGIKEEKRLSVIRMFNEGMKIDDIPRFTGLSKNEVDKILNN